MCSLQAAEACGSIEIDSALEGVKSLADDLEALERSADEGKLLPLPGESVSFVHLYFLCKSNLDCNKHLLNLFFQVGKQFVGSWCNVKDCWLLNGAIVDCSSSSTLTVTTYSS